MPSLNINFLQLLQDDYTKYNYFIETGTLNGETTFSLEPYFNNLITIEYSEHYYNNTKQKYKGNKINFILGDSSIVFNDLLPTITSSAIFFLDGHWSSGNTGKSEKDCPLMEEMLHINNLFQHEAIIIIDDYRLFGQSIKTGLEQDWSEINKETLLDVINSRINKIYHLDSEYAKDDRLIIHINEINANANANEINAINANEINANAANANETNYNIFNNCDSKTNGEEKFYLSIKDSINTIFDVGCRQDSEFTAFDGEVHYFDPDSSFIENLSIQPNSNKKSIFNNFGLGDDNKELFYYPKYQSFYDRVSSCHISDDSNKIKLTIKKAKDYIIENDIKSIDFLKIDTEGFELSVLKGFEDYLEIVKNIQFEYGGTYLDNNTKLIDVIDYLKKFNFCDFSYLTKYGKKIITNFDDHYQYCNIVCTK